MRVDVSYIYIDKLRHMCCIYICMLHCNLSSAAPKKYIDAVQGSQCPSVVLVQGSAACHSCRRSTLWAGSSFWVLPEAGSCWWAGSLVNCCRHTVASLSSQRMHPYTSRPGLPQGSTNIAWRTRQANCNCYRYLQKHGHAGGLDRAAAAVPSMLMRLEHSRRQEG